MSAAAPHIATGSHRFATAADKEALVQFWRSGLEHIARGIAAHHNIARDTRIRDLYARRGAPTGSPTPSLEPQIASHKEILETCVLALAELAASGLAHSSISHQTQQSPSLESRVAALEDQMKARQATIRTPDAEFKALSGNLTRMESRIVVCEEKTNATAAGVDKSHKDLESRIAELSAQIANPPPIQDVEHDRVNERLGLIEEKVQTSQDESQRLRERLTAAETKITLVEATRARVDVHGTKLTSLSSAPTQIRQAGQDIQTLKGQQEATATQISSLESALVAVERKLGEANKKVSALPGPSTAEIPDIGLLKGQVTSLAKLPATMEQLQASVAELAPLKLRSQELTALAAQAPQLLGLISHNERVQDDITQIRSKLARYNKETAEAKKENAETIRVLNEEIMTLSAKNQTIQSEILGKASQLARLELSVKSAEEISQDVAEKMNGIDARFKANQVTAQWAQEQIRTMRADITYLEPLKAQREALLLLSGRTEELIPLSIRLRSSEFQGILRKGEQADEVKAATKVLTTELLAVCRQVQERLSRVEPHVTQLESDVSTTLEKLSDLQQTSSTTELQARNAKQSLQKLQNDVAPLLTFKPGIPGLMKLVPHSTSLISLVDEVRALQKLHASDIPPIKGEVKKIKSISNNVTSLRTDIDDAKGQIAPLLTLQQQFQTYLDSFDKLEQRVAKLEPATIRTPATNRVAGFSLSQSLGAGSSSSGTTRWKVSTTPKKTSNAAQQQSQPERTTTPPPVSETQPQLPLHPPGGSIKLTQVPDELAALIEKAKQTETEVTNLSRSLNRFEKQLGELDDSVHGVDQLMTTVQKTSDDNQVTLKLLEREFQNVKDGNVANLKEVDLKQAHITVMENEIQSLKLDVGAKLKTMETTATELAPLKEHVDMLISLARPVFSPISPAPHGNAAPPESRLDALERSLKSANKEIKNISGWILRAQEEIKNKNWQHEFQALEGHVRELADSIQTANPLAASLTERAPDLLGLLERPSEQLIQLTPEQLEGVARATTRMKTLEEQIHALRTSQPKLKEGLEQVTYQVGELVPTINSVVKPFTDHVKSILSLVPLSNHVPSLVPLIDQVPQLHASIQSLSDRVDAVASAAAAQSPADPSPASQLRSPVTDRELTPAEEHETNDNAVLFVPATNEPRLNKRRRMDEMFESLENQISSMQGELDGVTDDVKILCAERGKAKKIRLGEKKQPAGPQPLDPESRKKISEDVDHIMDQLRSLFEGEGVWPERIDIALGRHWAQMLQAPQSRPGAGASATIAKLCEELEVLKTVLEAHGSGTAAPPSAIDAVHIAWAESLTEKVMADVNKEQLQFKGELEELISRALQPMKKVFKVFKETPDIGI